MDLLNSLESFVCALDEGSLSAAARRLGKTQPAISQIIAALEKQTGSALIHRSARGVTPTRAGDIVYKHAMVILEHNRAMIADLEALGSDLEGPMRISVSFALGNAVVSPVVLSLRESHPELRITVRNEDRFVDVVREGYDLAIRIGSLGDGSGHARRIATVDVVLVATPDYLDRKGRPANHETLNSLDHIQYRDELSRPSMPLFLNGQAVDARVRPTFVADNPNYMMSAVESGVGFARLPKFFVEKQLKDSTLEQLLPHYEVPGKPVYLIRPTSGPVPRRFELFIDRLLSKFAELPGVSLTQSAKQTRLESA
ncbi:LysR substrate-binding domain-containing protein [Hoeflea sp. TYP-13]|uniref:LysR family transcriptional regulator n=1 Tax=Hoeflea sp. TYP-13 TaxID=3230023 RepID=UPI0034C5DA22